MTLRKISPEELYKKMTNQKKTILLDVRAKEKYNEFRIEDPRVESLHVEKTDIFKLEELNGNSIESLPKDKEMIVTCTTGNSGAKCAAILSEVGYQVAFLDGGITAWEKYLEGKDQG